MGLLDRFRRRGAPEATETGTHVAVDEPDEAPTTADEERGHLGRWLDISAGSVTDHPDTIEQIYSGDLDGASIRGVYSPAEVAAAVERIRGYSDEFRDHGTTIMFGTALVGSAPDRSDYFAGAPAINDRIGTFFEDDFVRRVADVLSALGGDRPTVVPVEGDASEYVPATVRFLPPDRGVMHAHTANEFCGAWDSYEHLRSIAVMWNSLSYFVVCQAPETGGELVLYDLMWDDTPADVGSLPMGPERDALLERFPTVDTGLREGDMVLFTGGRIWHRVTPVGGSRERVTIGGFAALSQDDQYVYFWS